MKRYAVVAGAVRALCGPAQARSNDDLKARLDQALKTLEGLQARVDGGVDLAPDADLRAQTVPLLGWLAYCNHA